MYDKIAFLAKTTVEMYEMLPASVTSVYVSLDKIEQIKHENARLERTLSARV